MSWSVIATQGSINLLGKGEEELGGESADARETIIL